MSMVESRFH